MAADMLCGSGCDTHTFSNGMDAVEFYQNSWEQVDLILLDMIMPVWDGGETYLKLRAINPNLKAILWSGYNADGKAQETIDAGSNAFLHKPFQQNDLIDTISRVLARD